MSPDERARIRQRRNEVQRRIAALDALFDLERQERACAHCGEPIPPERVGGGANLAIYCCPEHRQRAYRRRRAVLA